jgi:phage terminase large subunit-like protein
MGPGDYFGQPFRLTDFEKRWIWRLFEYYPETGLYRYKRALFGTGKGNGKTPIEGALGAEGLCGPTAPVSPLVLVAASTLSQSNLVFGDLKAGITHDDSPLKPYVDPMQFSIQLNDGPGEIKRVAAVKGSNDGPRATRLLADELHEWVGALADVFDILDGAIGKRQNAFTVGISTAGVDLESLLGVMYKRGKQLASGEIIDDESLFEWYEIPEEIEIPERVKTAAELKQWRLAIAYANPALSDGGFLHESYIRSRFDGAQAIERHKWLRYHGNRWTKAESAWLPPGKWADCVRVGRQLKAGEEIVLGFSGTYDGDSAGLVAGSLQDGFVQRLGSWEDYEDEAYEVPRDEVTDAVKQAMTRYKVKRFVVNPNGWHGEAQTWATAYGDRVVVLFDWMHQLKRRHDACSRLFTSVLTGEVGHDGDGAIARHLESATEKQTSEGAWITKASRTGPPIDLAVALVLVWDGIGVLGTRRRSAKLVTF